MKLKPISYAFIDEWGHLSEDPKIRDLRVEWRGAGTWAIKDVGEVLNRDGKWEYEPHPSSRNDNFIKRTRFSLEEAKQLIEKYLGVKPDDETVGS